MDEQEFRGRLMVLRIIWAALIMGVVIFGAVVMIVGPNNPPQDQSISRMLLYVAVAMAAALIPGGFVVRMIIWNKGRDETGAVAAGQYATGNILFWAMCEGLAFFALVGVFLNGGRGPHLIVAAIATAVMMLAFPTGNPMRGDGAIRPMHRHDSKL